MPHHVGNGQFSRKTIGGAKHFSPIWLRNLITNRSGSIDRLVGQRAAKSNAGVRAGAFADSWATLYVDLIDTTSSLYLEAVALPDFCLASATIKTVHTAKPSVIMG